ncbi:MAG: cation-translocating P-type ATPase, partial [Christensenellales bacterium]
MYFNSIEETEKRFKTNCDTGLSNEEVVSRLEIQGENKIESAKRKSFIKKLLYQFTDVMIIVLIIASIISFTINIMAKESLIEPIIIAGIVIANALLGAIQETKAEKSLNALKNLTSKTAKVIRDGVIKEIKSNELVCGDICILEDGDIIPADLRIIKCNNLKVDESTLTGESIPLEKNTDILPKDTPLANRTNMLYSGCTITSGNGVAIVVATGMNTELGKIAKLLNNEKHKKTPLQMQFAKLSLVLSIFAIIISVIVFVIGLIIGIDAKEMFMNSLSLAIATIPESLPAIITVILSLGVERLVEKKAIVKNLPAIETLGSASIICTDKTGTLTQNKMTVVKVYDYKTNKLYEDLSNNRVKHILGLASLCCNGTKDIGDPTEKAILQTDCMQLVKKYEKVFELPFDSNRKLMTTIHKTNEDKYIVVTKGAFESIAKLTKDDLTNAKFLNNDLAENAIRVLGVAIKEYENLPKDLTKVEKDLQFIGLIGMIDPPKLEVKEAIEVCYNAGIRPIMITGDNPITATSIAKTLGIFKENDIVLTGEDLKNMPNKKLLEILPKVSIYARVTPEDKIKIVKAWQKLGHIVAMTGDGVNDAPALKSADIGCV